MWTDIISDILLAAALIATSPIPIIAITLVLNTRKARQNGVLFALGWLAGLTVLSVLILLLADPADDPESATATIVYVLKLAGGLLLLYLALQKWLKRPKAGEEPKMPGWMATIDTITPGRAFVLGLTLGGLNPKNIAFSLMAVTTIAQAALTPNENIVALAAFVLLSSLTVAGPVLFYFFATRQTAAALERIKDFMSRHNAVIMTVLFIVFGVKLILNGLGGLTG